MLRLLVVGIDLVVVLMMMVVVMTVVMIHWRK
jgi:hypothetical protein